MDRFDTLLRRLAEADEADAALHRCESSLEERTRAHDELVALRAEMARLRDELGFDSLGVTGADSRTRRFRPNG